MKIEKGRDRIEISKLGSAERVNGSFCVVNQYAINRMIMC